MSISSNSGYCLDVLGYFSFLVLLLAIFRLKRIVGMLLNLFFDDVLEKHGSQMPYENDNSSRTET
jgi:hypothetical protein